MRWFSLATVLGAALPAAIARPACRPHRPTTTSTFATATTTTAAGIWTMSTDTAITTKISATHETTDIVDSTITESAMVSSHLTSTLETTHTRSMTDNTVTALETTTTQSVTATSGSTTLIPTTTAETSSGETIATKKTTDKTTTVDTSTAQTTTSEATSTKTMAAETTTATTEMTIDTTTAETTTTEVTTAETITTTTAAAAPTGSIQNGNFEDTTNTAWDFQSAEIVNNPGTAHSDSRFAKINIVNAQASGVQQIYQTVTGLDTTKSYALSLYATVLDSPAPAGNPSSCFIYILYNTSFLFSIPLSFSSSSLSSYQPYTHTFTPSVSDITFHFSVRCGRGPPTTFSVAIDDVSLLQALS
ncbi:hypothetical protein FOYG_06040 [Fusarium oxysporum NRRL 32931]|uniref:CBM-cenC domain-containing protein n=1 Tax=Fusarium oxysporum NRRL 32931 TaxID=660029 RepID=W9IJ13_FUSOX|nr:hypothetical protein FOYG_06040 [Fusarium oxysporum NRRL 32931]